MEVIKKMHRIKLLSLLTATAVLSVVVGGSAMATSHDNRPVFNHKTDTPFIIAERPIDADTELTPEYCDSVSWCELRDEADFLRLGQGEEERYGEAGSDLDICTDETLNFWFYVHNGTSELYNNKAGNWESGDASAGDFWDVVDANLNGPAVALNTTVRLSLPEEAGNSHTITASINADHTNEVVDTVQITCSDETKEISVVYVEETVLATRAPPDHGSIGSFALLGNLASEDGAILGYSGGKVPGIVPSCFEFASVIRGKLSVVVTEATEVVDDDPEVDEDPDDTPEAGFEEDEDLDEEGADDEEPDEEPDEEGAGDEDTPDEDAPEDIPPLGAGATTPLAAVALSSVLGAFGYRAVRSSRR